MRKDITLYDRDLTALRWSRLIRATERLAQAQTYDDVVEIVRSDVRDVVDAEGVTFVVREGGLCHYVVENAVSPLWAGSRFEMSKCISGWSMLYGRSAVIPNIYEDDRIPIDAYRPTFVATLVMTPVGVPAVAAIGAYWSRPHKPSKETVLQLEELSKSVAAALDRVSPMTTRDAPAPDNLLREAQAVGQLDIVPTVLDAACQVTGMGFAAVARVTDDRWIACAVKDGIGLGLKPGGELHVKTTICDEIRSSHTEVCIDDVATDARYCQHPTPAMYGFRSYISVPIIRRDGSFFGTLCALDPAAAPASRPDIVVTFKLFARLIAECLDAQDRVVAGEKIIHRHRETDVLREQFIAVLGHDLRNPLAALVAGVEWLDRRSDEQSSQLLARMRNSAKRMAGLIDDVLDFARGRLGDGLGFANLAPTVLSSVLQDVVAEARTANPDRAILTDIEVPHLIRCDASRIAQLLSNLVANALTHGAPHVPIRVEARTNAMGLLVQVTNSGKPIPVELRDRLFEPFARSAAGDPRRGLGLGLYICAQIAQAHGGELTFTSDERETSFRFEMPN